MAAQKHLRIIGGQWRSRRLVAPPGDTTRPMPDRVKEAVFNMLASRFGTPGTLPRVRVADVFAGSGSMGLEALSRGAVSCCFFERDRGALATLRRNLDALGVGSEGTICSKDAWRSAIADLRGRPFDLVFLDPPYRDSGDVSSHGAVRRYLHRLTPTEEPAPIVVLHHDARAVHRLDGEPRWRVDGQRTFGSSAITFFVL